MIVSCNLKRERRSSNWVNTTCIITQSIEGVSKTGNIYPHTQRASITSLKGSFNFTWMGATGSQVADSESMPLSRSIKYFLLRVHCHAPATPDNDPKQSQTCFLCHGGVRGWGWTGVSSSSCWNPEVCDCVQKTRSSRPKPWVSEWVSTEGWAFWSVHNLLNFLY